MSIRGDLNLFHPIEILQIIKTNRATGILLVKTSLRFIGIYFFDGDIVFAAVAESVEELLQKKNITSFLKEIKSSNREEFARLMRDVRRAISEFTKAKDGTFTFEEVKTFIDDKVKPTVIPTETVIIEESRKINDINVLNKKISDPELVFEKKENYQNILRKAQLNVVEYKILDLVDGKNTVQRIIELSGLSEETVKRVLFALLCAGIIGRAAKKPALKKRWFTLGILRRLIDKIKGL